METMKNTEEIGNIKILPKLWVGDFWDKSLFAKFNKNKCWLIGYDKTSSNKGAINAWKNIKQVNIGDYLIFRKLTVKENKIEVLQVSKITEKDENKGEIYFEKIPNAYLYKGRAPSNQQWRGTLFQIKEPTAIKIILGEIKPMENNNVNLSVENYVELLKNTHNIILHGAPGTGKTHLAKEIAKQMPAEIEFVQFHPSYDYTDFVEGLRPIQEEGNAQIGFKREDGIFKKLCKNAIKNLEDSEKSQDILNKEKYINDVIEDFINNAIEEQKELKTTYNRFFIEEMTENHIVISVFNNDKNKIYKLPINNLRKLFYVQNNSSLERKDLRKIFYHQYSNALDSYLFSIYQAIKKNLTNQQKNTSDTLVQTIEKKNYIIIIDEINRGDFSKIFGELFFTIDPDYRGKKGIVKTQYQNLIKEENDAFFEGFYVPENVYIIGTMNDIDRSVESMDFAFRRRFSFVEIKAKDTAEGILSQLDKPHKEKCQRIMDNLNAEISQIKEFGSPDDYHIGAAYFLKLKTINYDYEKFWKYHLSGLLKEYFRGLENASELLKDFEDKYKELQ